MIKAQFTDADVAEATKGLGATVCKPRKAKKPQCRAKSSKGFVKGSGGLAVGYPTKVFV